MTKYDNTPSCSLVKLSHVARIFLLAIVIFPNAAIIFYETGLSSVTQDRLSAHLDPNGDLTMRLRYKYFFR